MINSILECFAPDGWAFYSRASSKTQGLVINRSKFSNSQLCQSSLGHFIFSEDFYRNSVGFLSLRNKRMKCPSLD
jgi:hypothetical protein